MNLLIVEDDAGVARLLRNSLKTSGFETDWVQSGAAARTNLKSNVYNALVLDLMLPDMDGFTLCHELRTAGSNIPILMLTARDSLDDKLEGFNAGVDDYLTKPFEVEELLARLRAIIRRKEPNDNDNLIVVGDVQIDLLAHEVRVRSQNVQLTRREFDILLYLGRNAKQTMNRDRILQAAWGDDADVTPNTVDVYIGYLRRKLLESESSVSIQTVRGVGFKLSW